MRSEEGQRREGERRRAMARLEGESRNEEEDEVVVVMYGGGGGRA